MNIYVIRHGETQWNREEIFRGRKDVPLNKNGLEQAEKTAIFLAGNEIEVIFSSPLKRAVQTAESILKHKKNMEIITSHDLIDMNFGIWEGLTLKEVEEKFPVQFGVWKDHPENWKVKDAETLKDIRKRVSRFLNSLKGYRNVALVSHRVICKIIIMNVLGLPLSRFWKIKIDTASVSLINKQNDYRLEYLNLTSHLENSLNKDF